MFDAEVCTAIPPSFECLNIGPVKGNKASLPKGVLFLKEEKKCDASSKISVHRDRCTPFV